MDSEFGPMSRRFFALISSLLAALGAVFAWVTLGSIEIGANDSVDSVAAALESVEATLAGSRDIATSTSDALNASAVSLETVAATSDATSAVAADIADVTATLPPVLSGVSTNLVELDESIGDINGILDSIPFVDTQISRVDPALTDIEPLLADLETAEQSLTLLSAETAQLGPDTVKLAAELRTVAAELEDSTVALAELTENVGASRRALIVGQGGPTSLNLLPAQLIIAALALAVIVSNIADLVSGAAPVRDPDAVDID